ncbi:MAG: hypothetical protein AB7L09_00585 [Nitrospira sp.]
MIDRVLLDLDGVLVDFLGGACRLHNKPYNGYPHDPATQIEQRPWDIEPLFEMTAPQVWDPMGREFWANLEPLPHCHEYVEILSRKFGEENICILTSPIRTDGCIDGKMDWIRRHLPQFSRRFLVGPAKQFCASPRHVLVDDHAKNIEAFRDAGGHVFMVPAPWNHRFKEYPVKALVEWVNALDFIARS